MSRVVLLRKHRIGIRQAIAFFVIKYNVQPKDFRTVVGVAKDAFIPDL